MNIQEKIKNLIKEALTSKGSENFSYEINIEHPKDLGNGDYSCTSLMKIYALFRKQIKEEILKNKNAERINDFSDFTKKILDFLNENKSKEIEKIEVKNGFINFYLSPEFFANSVKEILEKEEDYGRNETGQQKRVIVEYSSPNIAKPFTVGHLRSTIIGDALSNILAFSGYRVIRDNHIGDWGTQFGKLIVAIKKWGNLSEIAESAAPIKMLVDLYIRFHDEAEKDSSLEDEARAYFAKLEKKDAEATNIWKKCIELSRKEFDRIYQKLVVTPFDTAYGESFFEDKMQAVIDDIKKADIGKDSEGAFIVEFPAEKKLSPLLLLKKDGSSLYGLRDLAADRWRKLDYGNDIKIINEVGVEQSEYFRQIFETEAMLGYFKKEDRKHVAHGLYRFSDGKMSTRKGNVVWLDDIIIEAEKRAGAINEETREAVAIGAIKFNDLKRESLKDIIFDWEEVLNIKGDSGPYLQYSYARAKSILEKAKAENMKASKILPESWETKEIEKLLYHFPEVVLYSAEKLEAHHIANYLLLLAREFNAFYGAEKVVDKDDSASPYKISIVLAFSIVLKNGLHLLGIPTPEKM